MNIPGSRPTTTNTSVPGALTPNTTPPLTQNGVPKNASPLPLIVAGILLLASLGIYLFRFELGGGVWFFVGYALTPLLASLALGWDSILQRNGRRDPWFTPSLLFSRLIRAIVALSFVLAVFHILEIGTICGQGLVQTGVLCGS